MVNVGGGVDSFTLGGYLAVVCSPSELWQTQCECLVENYKESQVYSSDQGRTITTKQQI